MIELKVYKSRWKAVKLFLLSLPFVIASLYFIVNKNSDKTMNWFCLCFFGLGIPLSLFNFFDNRPELILNEEGIFDRLTFGMFDKGINKGFIKWSSIKDIYPKVYKNYYRGLPTSKQKYICFILDEDAKEQLKVGEVTNKLAQLFDTGDYTIPLMNLRNIDEQRFITLLKAMVASDASSRKKLLSTSQL